jgi:hypothetical protein
MYRSSVSFRVTRRIEWDADHADLRRHVDAFADALTASDDAVDVEIDADLASTILHLDMTTIDAGEASEALVRRTIAEAINEAGGSPEGLLTMLEEAEFDRGRPMSGLRRPRWKTLSFRFATAEP